MKNVRLMVLSCLAIGAAAKPLPSLLWAPQAFVPPGTTDARTLELMPGVSVPIGGAPGQAGGQMTVQPGIQPGVQPGSPSGVQPGLVPQGFPPGGPGAPPMRSPGAAPATPNTTPQNSPAVITPTPQIITSSTENTTENTTAATAPRICQVTLSSERMELGPDGGAFLVPAMMNPAACASSVGFSARWLKMLDEKNLQFVAQPNNTAMVREAMILVGGTAFFLRQSPPPQPGLAASPSRLVFAVNKKGSSAAKTLTAWSDIPAAKLTVRGTTPWLVVTPKKDKDGRQTYEIAVRDKAGLPAGRHDSAIEVLANDSAQRSVTIPVVVEVEGIFY